MTGINIGRSLSRCICGVLLGIAAIPTAVMAQNPAGNGADNGQLEEILVTAQRRTERLQDVPIAISAISSETIERLGIVTMSGLTATIPNVTFESISIVPSASVPYIRGIGEPSSDPLVEQPNLISVDGVDIIGVSGSLLDLWDVQQVEVLRGPQGTLQGRNATGGAIEITTRRPSLDEVHVRTSLDWGSYDTWTAKASVDGPLIQDKLAAKFSVVSTGSDGFVRDEYNGTRQGGRKYTVGRLGLLFTPTDTFDLYVTADFVGDNSQQPPTHAANSDIAYPRPQTQSQPVPVICSLFNECSTDPRNVDRSNFSDPDKTNQGGVSATANWATGPVKWTSVTGFREVKDHVNLDIDFTPVPLLQAQDQFLSRRTFSEEMRVASQRDAGLDFGGKLNWVAGIFFLSDGWNLRSPVCAPALGSTCDQAPAIQLDSQKTESYAGFGHADYSITDRWDVFAGARYTEDRKEYVGIVPVDISIDKSWSKSTTELGTDFHVTPNDMIYAKFSQGYRAGGINPSGVTYNPESLNAYEIGAKLEQWNRRLILNVAAFDYQHKNLQLHNTFPYDKPPYFIQGVENAGGEKTKGAEMEATVIPVADLRVQSSVGFLDARYTQFIDNRVNPNGTLTPVDDSALPLMNTPRWTLNGSIDYTVHLAREVPYLSYMLLSTDYEYRTQFYAQEVGLPIGLQPGYGLLNASIKFVSRSEHASVTFYGKNITNKYYILNGENAGGLSFYQTIGAPSTFGIRVEAGF